MALVVEDGTGLSTSNSYVSVDNANSYFSDRGNSTWEALDLDVKQYALVKATDYIDKTFNFIGQRTSSEQALQWPRNYAYDELGAKIDGVPSEVEKACAEYALRAASEELAPDPVYDETGGKVVEFKNKVDVIEESKKFSDSSSITTIRQYPAADRLLRHLLSDISPYLKRV